MKTTGPFGGKTGLKIRVAGLALFFVLALVFLLVGDRRDALWFGVFFVVGLVETRQYYLRL